MNERTDCRCCRGEHLAQAFSLGEQPFANAYLRSDQLNDVETKAPLVVMECRDCGHVQLQHVVRPEDLYCDYAFVTSSSQVMTRHFSDLMNTGVEKYVKPGGLVVEIGSNDGTALKSITAKGVRRLGVDPAENLSRVAIANGVNTLPKLFSEAVASEIVRDHGQADLIVACNVLGHIDDLDDFCRGVKSLLSEDGALIVEVPDVNQLVDRTEFDTIYHEHLSYFGGRQIETLMHRNGLRVEQTTAQNVHGGSIRLTIRHGTQDHLYYHTRRPARDWAAFRGRCEATRESLVGWLRFHKEIGSSVLGYCAAAKATVFLNYCNITPDLLPGVIDSTPAKQGRFIPGTHQPILPPEELLKQMPAAVWILAPNHFDEIVEREKRYREFGGTFR